MVWPWRNGFPHWICPKPIIKVIFMRGVDTSLLLPPHGPSMSDWDYLWSKERPPKFQRYIKTALGDMKTTICDPYMDNALWYHENFDGAVDPLDKVLGRLKRKVESRETQETQDFSQKGSTILRPTNGDWNGYSRHRSLREIPARTTIYRGVA